jgi:hypothetical protein
MLDDVTQHWRKWGRWMFSVLSSGIQYSGGRWKSTIFSEKKTPTIYFEVWTVRHKGNSEAGNNQSELPYLHTSIAYIVIWQGVTIDGFWIETGFIGLFDIARDYNLHFNIVHTLFSIVTSLLPLLVSGFNGGRSPFCEFPNYPLHQLPASNSNSWQQLNTWPLNYPAYLNPWFLSYPAHNISASII